MSALFAAASSQYLETTTLIPTLPFTVGFWFRMSAVSAVTRTIWSFGDTGSTDNYLSLQMTSTEVIRVLALDPTNSSVVTLPTAVAGQWTFVCIRFIATNERRASVLQMGNGTLITAAASTVARTPSGMDTIGLGALRTSAGAPSVFDGAIAEYWMCDADIFQTGSNLPDHMTWRLAFGGPFSIPRVAASLVEYRSLRASLVSTSDRPGDVWYAGNVPPVWTAVAGPTLTDHPPLPSWYKRPGQVMRPLVV